MLIGEGCETREQANYELMLLASCVTAIASLVCCRCWLCWRDGAWLDRHVGALVLAALNPWQCAVLRCGFSTLRWGSVGPSWWILGGDRGDKPVDGGLQNGALCSSQPG
jgi:hypothetical protein